MVQHCEGTRVKITDRNADDETNETSGNAVQCPCHDAENGEADERKERR